MYLTVDVGGTKTLLALFTPEGEMVAHEKFPTDMFYPTFMEQLKAAISKMTEGKNVEACAMGLPGVINREAGIVESFGNLLWTDVHVRDDLSSVLSCLIMLENDAKLAGLAEAYELRQLYSRVLYVTVSTGIGLGLVVEGKIDYSVHDAGGRALVMEHHGRLQAWEEFASGKAIVRHTGKMASEITDERDWYVVARNIAVGLIDLIVTLSPQCIVIGGGVGSHLPKFHEKLHEELEIYRSKMLSDMPQIVQAKHPEEAVVYGGYLLCKQQ